ncbi:MAG: hypothetical protein ACLFTR_02420 [Candidatus Woesearchaeota archaeon]
MSDITEPRSWPSTFVIFASVSAVPFAMMVFVFTDIPLHLSISSGVLFGLFFGFFMAYFTQGDTVKIKFRSKKKFMDRINTRISQIGYFLESHTGDFFMYKPSFHAGLLAGRISITFDGKTAIIVGPLMYVKKLEREFG